MLPKSPAYASIIQKLRAGASFLDIGCFIGQDLRRLVADGAPSDRLYAVDVVSHWDVGYDMYRDRDRFSAHFIEADILYPNVELRALMGTVDVVSITHVLHQWDWGGSGEGGGAAGEAFVGERRDGCGVSGWEYRG